MSQNKDGFTRTVGFSALMLTLVICLSTPAHAVDGVIEINQTRALAGGVTPTDTPGFPVTIDESGSYILTGTLAVPDDENVHVIYIDGTDTENIAIDLNGFALIGDMGGLPSSHVLYVRHVRSFTLRNGAIHTPNASVGVDVGYTGSAVIEDLTIESSTDYGGIHVLDGGNLAIRRNHIEGGGMIFVEGSVDTLMRGVIEDNVLLESEHYGIRVDARFAPITLRNNVVDSAGNIGIRVTTTDSLVLEGNSVRKSGNTGISLDTIRGGRVSGNVVTFSELDGIKISYAEGTRIENNISSHNTGSGLNLTGQNSCYVTGNTLNENDGAGLLLNSANNVFGANVARGNQGTGITSCQPMTGGLIPPDWCDRAGGGSDSMGDNMMPGPPAS